MPLDAIAWIIAIERYAGESLSIKQPVASFALDFADLMICQHVSKIVLSTSLNKVPDYERRLSRICEAQGVEQTGAELADIQNALEKVRGKGTLFIYWIGHGIMAPERQLLCADSRGFTDLRGINLDSMLKHLRATEYPREQIGFLDCCAQVVTNSPAVLYLGGEGKVATRQFFYHAASAGEIASGTKVSAGFSSTVLQTLNSSNSFPPAPISEFFDRLKTALGTIPLQTRPFLQRTDESGDRWSSGDPESLDDVFSAAYFAGLSQSQFDHLWHPIRQTAAKPAELAQAYVDGTLPAFIDGLRTAQPASLAPALLERAVDQLALEREFEPLCLRLRLSLEDWIAIYDRAADGTIERPARLEDLSRLLLSALDQANEENGLRSFITLLEFAARRANNQEPTSSQTLRDGLIQNQRLKLLYREIVQDMPIETEKIYLLLALDWEQSTKTASLTKAWTFMASNGKFSQREISRRCDLAGQINYAAQKVIKEYPNNELTVELLAPNDLLCAPRELLELINPVLGTYTWLEKQYPITFRWLNRMSLDEDYLPGSWMQTGGPSALV